MSRVAYIRENECIGCTKCIAACPFDAIIGTAKQMHTVISNECIGCDLCIAPCPVDCIEMIAADNQVDPLKTKQRVIARKQRKKIIQEKEIKIRNEASAEKSYLQAVLERAKVKKNIL